MSLGYIHTIQNHLIEVGTVPSLRGDLTERARGEDRRLASDVTLKVRLRSLTLMAFVPAVVASTIALHAGNSIAGLIVIGPGYLVQAWLFERHWALGGVGYDATMVGVSALFWTALLVILVSGSRAAVALVRRFLP
jgi:hypothetical protein